MTIMTALEYKKYIQELKRKNKYKNNRSKCNQGHYHQSTGEAYYCDYLMLMKKTKVIKDYESQVRYDLVVNGIKITTHIPDFVVTTNEDKKEVHEYKGKEIDLWRIKHRLFETLYPEIPYIVIKDGWKWK